MNIRSVYSRVAGAAGLAALMLVIGSCVPAFLQDSRDQAITLDIQAPLIGRQTASDTTSQDNDAERYILPSASTARVVIGEKDGQFSKTVTAELSSDGSVLRGRVEIADVPANRTYRVRVTVQDSDGSESHYGEMELIVSPGGETAVPLFLLPGADVLQDFSGDFADLNAMLKEGKLPSGQFSLARGEFAAAALDFVPDMDYLMTASQGMIPDGVHIVFQTADGRQVAPRSSEAPAVWKLPKTSDNERWYLGVYNESGAEVENVFWVISPRLKDADSVTPGSLPDYSSTALPQTATELEALLGVFFGIGTVIENTGTAIDTITADVETKMNLADYGSNETPPYEYSGGVVHEFKETSEQNLTLEGKLQGVADLYEDETTMRMNIAGRLDATATANSDLANTTTDIPDLIVRQGSQMHLSAGLSLRAEGTADGSTADGSNEGLFSFAAEGNINLGMTLDGLNEYAGKYILTASTAVVEQILVAADGDIDPESDDMSGLQDKLPDETALTLSVYDNNNALINEWNLTYQELIDRLDSLQGVEISGTLDLSGTGFTAGDIKYIYLYDEEDHSTKIGEGEVDPDDPGRWQADITNFGTYPDYYVMIELYGGTQIAQEFTQSLNAELGAEPITQNLFVDFSWGTWFGGYPLQGTFTDANGDLLDGEANLSFFPDTNFMTPIATGVVRDGKWGAVIEPEEDTVQAEIYVMVDYTDKNTLDPQTFVSATAIWTSQDWSPENHPVVLGEIIFDSMNWNPWS